MYRYEYTHYITGACCLICKLAKGIQITNNYQSSNSLWCTMGITVYFSIREQSFDLSVGEGDIRSLSPKVFD